MVTTNLSRVNCNKFRTILKFVSKDDSRRNIQCVFVEMRHNNMKIVATNGIQMAVVDLETTCKGLSSDNEVLEFTIPYSEGALLGGLLTSSRKAGSYVEMKYLPEENTVIFRNEPNDEELVIHTKKHPPEPILDKNGNKVPSFTAFPEYKKILEGKQRSVFALVDPEIGLDTELLKNMSGIFKCSGISRAAARVHVEVDEKDNRAKLVYFVSHDGRSILAIAPMRM